jgi:hypothetical protein
LKIDSLRITNTPTNLPERIGAHQEFKIVPKVSSQSALARHLNPLNTSEAERQPHDINPTAQIQHVADMLQLN